MKRLLLTLSAIALLGAGCGGSQPATPSAKTNDTPKAEAPTNSKTKTQTSLEASFDSKVSPRPACSDISGIKNSMKAGSWVAGNDRGIAALFPPLPTDTELCGHYSTTKIIMYATGLSPNEALAYYKEKLEGMGFTTTRKTSQFKGMGYLDARKDNVASVNIVVDGNNGFISFNYTDWR